MTRALFVEGPSEPMHAGHSFVRLWQEAVLDNLALPRFDHIFPINKKLLIAMRPDAPKMSGAALALDAYIELKRKEFNFNCAVVAWDLVPGWAGGIKDLCRWKETIAFYQGLADSMVLPEDWRAKAAGRVYDLTNRPQPSARIVVPTLGPGVVLGVCMENMFESLIASDEKMVKYLLGCKGVHVKQWPRGWKRPPARVDMELISPAIMAARRIRPPRKEAFAVDGDMITHKNEWGVYFLRHMLGEGGSTKAKSHPICIRLQEIL